MSDRQDIEAIMQAAKVAIPCVVTGFEQLDGEPFVNVIPSINKKKLPRDEGQDTEFVQTAEILEVPILYPSTARFAMTLPIDVGDRGWLLHSDLDLDNWNLLDVPETASSRFHDLNDCVFMPGGWPRPKFMGGYATDKAVLRTTDNTTNVSISDDGIIRLSAATELQFNAPTISVNGVPWETMNPGYPATFVVVPPGVPDAPEEVDRP